MGQRITIFEPDSYQVAMLGLDNAGKSTIVSRLKLDQYVQHGPTVGFNCEKFRPPRGAAKNHTFVVWDVGGQEKLRPLWRTYVRQTDAVVFVVDSCDEARFDECRLELLTLIREAQLPAGVPVLILANKQDLPEALNPEQVHTLLGVESCARHGVSTAGCCAVTGEGLEHLFNSLHALIQNGRKIRKR